MQTVGALFLGFVASQTFAQYSLCGEWTKVDTGVKCASAQSCCLTNKVLGDGSCLEPLAPDTSLSFITDEDFEFAGDGTYRSIFRLGTGNCPISLGSITLLTGKRGTYEDMGDNSGVTSNTAPWRKLKYSPKANQISLLKTNKPIYYTEGTLVQSTVTGPCEKADLLFNNPEIGCPCNSTWAVDGTWVVRDLRLPASADPIVINVANYTEFQTDDYSKPFPRTSRSIEKSECPLDSNGNTTCPDAFFFDERPTYGNYRVTYKPIVGTNDTEALLELTQPSIDSTIGYARSTSYYSFTSINGSCSQSLDPDDTFGDSPSPTAAPTVPPARISAATPRSVSTLFLVVPLMSFLFRLFFAEY